MQATDMHSLRRTVFSHKQHFINTLCSHNKPSLNPSSISFNDKISPKSPKFPRHFLSTPHHRQTSTDEIDDVRGWTTSTSSSSSNPSPDDPNPKPDKNPNVETFYDPTTGSMVTRRGNNNQNDKVKEAETVNGVTGLDYGRRVYAEVIGGVNGKKKGKIKTAYVCSNCGYEVGQWWGYCKKCNAAGTMTRFSIGEESGKMSGMEVSRTFSKSWLGKQAGEGKPIRLTDVNRGTNELDWRIPLSGLFGAEVARVLGGGLVPGSLVLIGGDPGVGKSSLLLQIAAIIAEGHETVGSGPVVYVSGEESVEQIGNRADRMKINTEELFLYSSTDVEDILEKCHSLSPRALVIDSIQTVYLKGVTGSAGGIYQVKECTSAFLRFAKKTNIPILLVGHVTKTGDIAGPRVLEHIVDAVLYMEGEKYSSHRLLRSVKNRFGSTDELGVFEMSQSGLQAVTNPSEMFLSEEHSDSEVLAGLAVAVTMDASRAFIVEIQGLCVAGSSILRQVNGVQAGRADMIISVLMKQVGLKLQENGIFLNVVSGISLTETAGDLAVAAAICSSFLEYPIPRGTAFIGEIGLAGELRTVARMEKRINTVAKLGYKKCIVPKSAEKSLSEVDLQDLEVVGCRNLKDMINSVFRKS